MRLTIGSVTLLMLLGACQHGGLPVGSGGGGGGGGGNGGNGGGSGGGGNHGQNGPGEWIWQGSFAPPAGLNALWVSGADNVWGVGDNGSIVHFDGLAWATVPGGTMNHLHGIWGASPSDIWAVAGGLGGEGNYANMVHWDGQLWSPASNATSANLSGIWGNSAGDLWAVGDSVIEHYDGHAWSIAYTSDTNSFGAVAGSSAGDVWAAGDNIYPTFGDKQLFHLSGGSWTQLSSGVPNKGMTTIWASGSADAWAAGFGATTHWDGHAWTPSSEPLVDQVGGIWGSSSSDVWAVSAKAVIARYDGQSWSSYSSGGTPLTVVAGSSADNVWAGGAYGIFRFDPGASGTITCAQVSGICAEEAACAPGASHVTDYPCGDSGATCCVPEAACVGTEEGVCCDANGGPAPPVCHNGQYICVGGAQKCLMPPQPTT
jgi:hypothetical protein